MEDVLIVLILNLLLLLLLLSFRFIAHEQVFVRRPRMQCHTNLSRWNDLNMRTMCSGASGREQSKWQYSFATR